MDILDIILIVVVVAAFVHGLRLGAAVQVLSFAGGLIGLGVGIALILAISPHLHGEFLKTFVALLLLLLPSTIMWGVGRQLGARIWRHLRGHRVAAVDAATGALIATAGTLVIVWLLASVLADSQVRVISTQVQSSAVVRFVAREMPPPPNVLGLLGGDLAGIQLPYIGIIQAVGPVALPTSRQVSEAVAAAGKSTVQIVAVGCGNIVVEGSGFVVAPGLVVTNAHVVAGSDDIVEYDTVQSERATPILFDPTFDLAVLRVPGLKVPPLRIDGGYVSRGTKATVLGYPEGQSTLNAQAAGVLLLFDPESPNIYNTATTQREIYELQSLVRPGNSGGPLVEADGAVIGVVFSRDSNDSRIGFALASPGVLQRVRTAEARPVGSSVGTGSCINGS